MTDNEVYSFLKENNENVLFCERTGNLISVFCKDDVKVIFQFPSVKNAQYHYRRFRKELEEIYV